MEKANTIHIESVVEVAELKPPFVLTIASGKGGVGKSILAANLALEISKRGKKVLLLDADSRFPNLHLICGAEPPLRLSGVYAGMVDATSAIFKFDNNLDLLADMPASGLENEEKQIDLLDVFSQIVRDTEYDLIIIDTPAGAGENVIAAAEISDLVSVVVTDEPTSILDAYALIKILISFMMINKIGIIVNNVIDSDDSNEISEKLNLATNKFLNAEFDLLGFIPYDRGLRKSIVSQELFMSTQNSGETYSSFIIIIDKILRYLEMRSSS